MMTEKDRTDLTRKIIFEDGTVFRGYGFGSSSEKKLELVFNTSMAGYQEILSDPSYTGQAVVMTYTVIGNYGINDDDFETETPSLGALIVRDYTDEPSNFRCSRTLSEIMEKYDITGVCGIDTRLLTRRIRDYGSSRVMITDNSTPDAEALSALRGYSFPADQVRQVSTRKVYEVAPSGTEAFSVVAIDCGIKKNILRQLSAMGCRVTVVPYDSDPEFISSLSPDGLFISNGPGDPEDVMPAIDTVRRLHGRIPAFGICLGHQILALSYGARTYKLKFGHRGGNHPVRSLSTGRVDITSQNHSYAVEENSLKTVGLKVTHINILDNTVEGIEHVSDPSFGIQYHPESAPGPNDSIYLFRKFLGLMERRKS